MARLHHRTAAVGLVGLLAAAPAGAQAPTAAASLPAGVRAAVDSVFGGWSGTDRPGCALGIARDGAVVYERGYGMANLEHDVPITPASVFHVASISKQFTAAAVALLARDGRLSLDDDVRRWIPELPDHGHRITLRHLLAHTSGLRDQWDLLYLARGRFEENRITTPDVLDIVTRQRQLNFAPGTEYLYSNTGYTLAAIVVERASGQSLRDFAEARFFRPLGMAQTHFHDDYTMVVPGRAAGYAPGRRGAPWRVSLPNFDTYGATSLFTTVGDLLRWEANLDRTTVGDAALWRDLAAPAVLVNGDTTGYGLGLATERHRGAWLVGHGGADAGYRAYVGRLPEHELAIAVLCNAATANPSALARAVIDAVIGDRLAAVEPAPRAASAPSRAELARLAGPYLDPVSGAVLWLSLRGDALVAGRTGGPVLVPQGGGRFRVAGQPVELRFGPDGVLVDSVLAWPARRATRRVRQTPSSLGPAELARYAGAYASEELGGTVYTVQATDSTLRLHTRGGDTLAVTPAFGDTFTGPRTVTFTRGRDGAIDGLELSTGRVRRLRFTRLPADPPAATRPER